jgi:hypothetical protein
MKSIKQLLAFVLLAGLAASAHAAAQWSRDPGADFQVGLSGPPPAHASLYSFSDVFRLTVAGAAMAQYPLAALGTGPGLPEYPMRVVSAEPQAAGYVFSIGAVRRPEQWLLLLSGLALAGWVARRRLIYSF